MKSMRLYASAFACMIAIVMSASGSRAGDATKPHRIAIHIDQNDPAVMGIILNNISNVTDYYHGKGEDVQIEVVAHGPGLNMLREDKSPVKDRIKQVAERSFPSKVSFSACGNTKTGMEKAEGHAITLIPQATVVPAGVVRLNELQEQGWSYIRP